MFWSLSWSGWLISSVSLLSLFSLQHCSWHCILSSSRWLQLQRRHLLLLFHLLALAGTVGKMNLQGLSAPSSITSCQTCFKKSPKAEEVLASLVAVPGACSIQDSASFWLFSRDQKVGKRSSDVLISPFTHIYEWGPLLIGKYRSPAAKSNRS